MPTLHNGAKAEVISAGVDWVTATSRDKSDIGAVLGDFHEWFVAWSKMGEKERKEHRLGYVGMSIQSVFLGKRADGWMLQTSGAVANGWISIVVNAKWHVTRIDLQVTGVITDEEGKLAQELAAEAASGYHAAQVGKHPKLTLITGYGDGDTVSSGARTSSRFGRIYDKYRESHGEYPLGSWRFEVEFKQEYAEAVVEAIRKETDTSLVAQSVVVEFFKSRGMTIPLSAPKADVPLSVEKVEVSDEKSLRWLHRNVRPTVERLVKAGKRDAVIKALGLTE